ncbi:MAG: hypothetical protein IKX76_00385, partial [Eubacterium sp.]|nr:hypothetical protein [Eubacterium sp.]
MLRKGWKSFSAILLICMLFVSLIPVNLYAEEAENQGKETTVEEIVEAEAETEPKEEVIPAAPESDPAGEELVTATGEASASGEEVVAADDETEDVSDDTGEEGMETTVADLSDQTEGTVPVYAGGQTDAVPPLADIAEP